ncbi:hypothetical protein EOE67_16280 [Rheinheimera riviphila]|uniref:Uncharacterized protein n=1 Tax=Rheinheimera riviphila TaxID=1834037 RepID=A0A437QG98_9GAMM|nr:hypothetical protein [Rheinheimera riviphila]RVU33573.1 hypothetical protein EOE67_16280 [Rheinheimera riviphila]
MAADEQVAVFDRFGWYWQPASWLQQMSPQDAVTATRQAIDLSPITAALQSDAAQQQQRAAAKRSVMQHLLDSLEQQRF